MEVATNSLTGIFRSHQRLRLGRRLVAVVVGDAAVSETAELECRYETEDIRAGQQRHPFRLCGVVSIRADIRADSLNSNWLHVSPHKVANLPTQALLRFTLNHKNVFRTACVCSQIPLIYREHITLSDQPIHCTQLGRFYPQDTTT